MADYLTLCQNLRREIGAAGGGTIPSAVTGQTGTNLKIVNLIADADIYIQSMHWDYNFLWSQYQVDTVVGNATPTVPADLGVWDVDSFYLDYSAATHKKLVHMDYIEWRRTLRQGVKTNKKPSWVVIKPDNNIVLESPPDAVYSLTADYWKTPARMVDATDVSDIPEQFQRIILVQAKLWFAEEQEIPSLYQAASLELNGDKDHVGLIDLLNSNQLPQQKSRRMGVGTPITVRPV